MNSIRKQREALLTGTHVHGLPKKGEACLVIQQIDGVSQELCTKDARFVLRACGLLDFTRLKDAIRMVRKIGYGPMVVKWWPARVAAEWNDGPGAAYGSDSKGISASIAIETLDLAERIKKEAAL